MSSAHRTSTHVHTQHQHKSSVTSAIAVSASAALLAISAGAIAQSWDIENLHPTGSVLSAAIGAGGGCQVGIARFGSLDNLDTAAKWCGTSGTYQSLHPTWASESAAADIARGQIVGSAVRSGTNAAILWNSSGTITVLHPTGALSSGATATDGYEQAGWVNFTGLDHAVVWSGSSSSVVDLKPAGSAESQARGIDQGRQVGWARIGGVVQAGRWDGSAASFVSLHPTGAFASQATSISGDQIAGWFYESGGSRAALWQSPGDVMINLHPTGKTYSNCYGVSNAIQVGVADNRAAMWAGSAASYVDLHALLPSDFFSSVAWGIDVNSTGVWIVGQGVNTTTSRIEALLWHYERPTYTMTDLGTLGGDEAEANAISDTGIVVGAAAKANGTLRAFRWESGVLEELDAPTGSGGFGNTIYESIARDVNSHGEIVGDVQTSSGRRGLFWEIDEYDQEVLITLHPFDGDPATDVYAFGISDKPEFSRARVVGSAVMPDGTINGYRWTNENFYNFNNEFYPTVYENTEASQIIRLNSSLTCGSTFELTTTGDLLSRALVWYGSYQDLGTLRAGGAGSAGALGMNWNNIVVGWSESDPAPAGPGGVRAFYIDVQDPTMLDLGALGGLASRALRVNDQRQVVGWWADTSDVRRAFIWENGVAFDLNLSVSATGWRIEEARDINESGDIAAVAINPTGQRRAVVLERQP